MRLTMKEQFLCSHMDGTRTLDEIGRGFEERFRMKITPANLEAFVRTLADEQLLDLHTGPRIVRPIEKLKPVPGNADVLFRFLAKWFSWVYGWIGWSLGVGTGTLAVVLLAVHGPLIWRYLANVDLLLRGLAAPGVSSWPRCGEAARS
jgi:hypothetical protein